MSEILCDLLNCRFPPELLKQRRGPTTDAMERPRTIKGHSDNSTLFSQRLKNGLAYPPHRIADELDALGLIELMGGADEAEIAFVD